MDKLTIHLHPGAARAEQWRSRARSAGHLRRGELEGSMSGWYAACIALVVSGIATRAHVRTLQYEHRGMLEEFANLGMRSYRGLDAKGMAELLQTIDAVAEVRRITGRQERIVRKTLDRLAAGDVAVVSISDTGFHDTAWRTAIGVEWRADTTGEHPTALLLLDPRHPCADLMLWNGRLEIGDEPDIPMRYYDAEGGICSARLKAVFTLSRKQVVPWAET